MNRCSKSKRVWIVVALAAPLAVVGIAGFLDAQQIRPGGMPNPQVQMPMPKPQVNPPPGGMPNPQVQMPNPQFNQPQIQMQQVWKCSRCFAVIGTGAAPPATCPRCNARILNGVGGGNNNNPAPNVIVPPQNVMPPPNVMPNNGGGGGGAPNPTVTSTTPRGEGMSGGVLAAVIIGAVVGFVVIAGGIGLILYFTLGSKPAKKKRRRDGDDLGRRVRYAD